MTLASPRERGAAIRERAEAARAEAEWKREMSKKQSTSPMGIPRRKPDIGGAQDAINQAHQQVTEMLTGVAEAKRRSQLLGEGEAAERASDSRRQGGGPR